MAPLECSSGRNRMIQLYAEYVKGHVWFACNNPHTPRGPGGCLRGIGGEGNPV
jgi:hypothetical protein